MNRSGALNKLICRVLVGVFLFAQFAVAAYACPGLTQRTSTAAQEMAEPGSSEMPDGCGQMDPKAANLCAEHCKFGHESNDTSPAPTVAAPVLAVLYMLPAFVEANFDGPPATASDSLLAAWPPPHAILNYVLRI